MLARGGDVGWSRMPLKDQRTPLPHPACCPGSCAKMLSLLSEFPRWNFVAGSAWIGVSWQVGGLAADCRQFSQGKERRDMGR